MKVEKQPKSNAHVYSIYEYGMNLSTTTLLILYRNSPELKDINKDNRHVH